MSDTPDGMFGAQRLVSPVPNAVFLTHDAMFLAPDAVIPIPDAVFLADDVVWRIGTPASTR